MTPPCLNCERRKVGCHRTCDRYKKYQAYIEKLRKAREKDTEERIVTFDSVSRRIKKP